MHASMNAFILSFLTSFQSYFIHHFMSFLPPLHEFHSIPFHFISFLASFINSFSLHSCIHSMYSAIYLLLLHLFVYIHALEEAADACKKQEMLRTPKTWQSARQTPL